jgi:hypothetical protein
VPDNADLKVLKILSDNGHLYKVVLGAHSALLVKVTTVIGKARVDDLVAYLHPDIACCPHRADSAKEVVGATSDDEATEEVQVINVLCADRNFDANGPHEADYIDQNAGNVGGIGTPIETEIVKVRRVLSG